MRVLQKGTLVVLLRVTWCISQQKRHKKQNKKNHPEKNSYVFSKESFSYIFSKEIFSCISGNTLHFPTQAQENLIIS